MGGLENGLVNLINRIPAERLRQVARDAAAALTYLTGVAMDILVTGAAGFIGSALCLRLLERGDSVVGIDNLNDYYDVRLKQARLARLRGYPALRS